MQLAFECSNRSVGLSKIVFVGHAVWAYRTVSPSCWDSHTGSRRHLTKQTRHVSETRCNKGSSEHHIIIESDTVRWRTFVCIILLLCDTIPAVLQFCMRW